MGSYILLGKVPVPTIFNLFAIQIYIESRGINSPNLVGMYREDARQANLQHYQGQQQQQQQHQHHPHQQHHQQQQQPQVAAVAAAEQRMEDVVQPLKTERLRPTRQKTKNAVANILRNGGNNYDTPFLYENGIKNNFSSKKKDI